MSAAARLEGLQLNNGWSVKKHLPKTETSTGGMFSESYLVENEGKTGFLKAFDFSNAFFPGVDTIELLQKYAASYEHERDILSHCRDRRLSNVVMAIESGEVQVPGLSTMEGRVYYMIFEMANCDIRVQMSLDTRFDTLLCVKAIRDVCLGLHQVHREMIAHQDTKPSNVLLYKGAEKFKVADFGRSSRKGRPIHHDNFVIAGDPYYAPPELLYGFTHPDFGPRRIGCDMYMLGNLVCFLFSGANITSQLVALLDGQHHPKNWSGTYQEVLPYLQNTFSKVLYIISHDIDEIVREDILSLISELCNPDLSKRGFKKVVGHSQQYSLERYVSRLNLLVSRVQILTNASKRTAA